MKLHHFITAEATESGKRARELGKALTPTITAPPAREPVTEVKLTDIKKLEPKKVAKAGDVDQEMRDYAVDQLASSPHHAAHHKIKHYD